jgi:hypothetical protein
MDNTTRAPDAQLSAYLSQLRSSGLLYKPASLALSGSLVALARHPPRDMASSSRTNERKALDLSHHLSELAKRRQVSPLKGIFKYAFKPGIIMLAGGADHHSVGRRGVLTWPWRLIQVFRLRTTSPFTQSRPTCL